MANTKSAIKRTRKIKRQTAVNRSRKSRYRSALKKMNSIIEKKDKKAALLLHTGLYINTKYWDPKDIHHHRVGA